MKNKVVVLIIICLFLIGCSTKLTDAEKFKKEYESLNGTKINDKTIRNVNIDKNNPFVYKQANDIIEMMDNKETFVVYFGFSKCPWCRSIIESLIKVSEDLNLDKIYYVDVLDIRDTLTISDDGNVIQSKKGSDDYYKLLDYFDNVLSDYELYYNEEKIETNEKRIYAPNIISVVNGSPKELTTGISEKQTDAYMKLTDDMKEETYNSFKCIIECVLENNISCSTKKEC